MTSEQCFTRTEIREGTMRQPLDAKAHLPKSKLSMTNMLIGGQEDDNHSDIRLENITAYSR